MAATLLELRNRVYGYLNDLQSTSSFTGAGDRYPAYVVNSAINDSLIHYVKILNSNFQGYLYTSLSINILANVREYSLGPTFRSPIYEVRRTINQVSFVLTPFQENLIPIDTTPIPNSIWLPSYSLRQNNIIFNMFPDSNETGGVTVHFQGKVTRLAADGTELPDTLYDLEDCIVIRSVIRLLQAKDVTGALKSIGGWRQEIVEAETAFWQQVGNRYTRPDKPIPIEYNDEFYI